MGDYSTLRSQDIMTASIYSFLENLLAAVRTSETLASEAHERDQINVSSDIKPGGYSEDIFIFLSEREKDEYTCSVCYSVIKDAHQCSNGHKFCYSCIYVWSTCNRAGADCCPACRCDGVYARNEQLNEKIGGKRVKCQDEGCNWRGFLRDYSEHEHRHYEFKELSRSIDLPNLKSNDIPHVVTPPPVLSQLSIDIDKNQLETLENNSNETIPVTNDNAIINTTRATVSRTNITPRRLTRLSDGGIQPARAAAPRSSLNSYSRLTNITPRCPNYRHGTIYPPRPPRTARLNRPTPLNITESNHNESTQTSGADVHNEASHTPILSSLLDQSHDHLSRGASNTRGSHSPLFPAINTATTTTTTTRNNLSTERTSMEYRRLAPTYASRRHNMGFMTDGREHLATMLILLTSDLEDRITVRTQSRDNLSNIHPRTTGTVINNGSSNTIPISVAQSESNLSTLRESGARDTRRSTTNRDITRSSSRLQEFRNLNRRLSEVANSLDILIESTTRQGELMATGGGRIAGSSSSSGSSNDSSISDNDD